METTPEEAALRRLEPEAAGLQRQGHRDANANILSAISNILTASMLQCVPTARRARPHFPFMIKADVFIVILLAAVT